MTDNDRQEILDYIQLLKPEVFVVELRLKKGGFPILELRVDTDAGISMSECSKIARSLNRWFEEEDHPCASYGLEVSSPGIGEPLILIRQYNKNIDRDVRVVLKLGGESEGKLTAVSENAITIRPYVTGKNLKKGQKPPLSEKVKEISMEDIKESKVIIR